MEDTGTTSPYPGASYPSASRISAIGPISRTWPVKSSATSSSPLTTQGRIRPRTICGGAALLQTDQVARVDQALGPTAAQIALLDQHAQPMEPEAGEQADLACVSRLCVLLMRNVTIGQGIVLAAHVHCAGQAPSSASRQQQGVQDTLPRSWLRDRIRERKTG